MEPCRSGTRNVDPGSFFFKTVWSSTKRSRKSATATSSAARHRRRLQGSSGPTVFNVSSSHSGKVDLQGLVHRQRKSYRCFGAVTENTSVAEDTVVIECERRWRGWFFSEPRVDPSMLAFEPEEGWRCRSGGYRRSPSVAGGWCRTKGRLGDLEIRRLSSRVSDLAWATAVEPSKSSTVWGMYESSKSTKEGFSEVIKGCWRLCTAVQGPDCKN